MRCTKDGCDAMIADESGSFVGMLLMGMACLAGKVIDNPGMVGVRSSEIPKAEEVILFSVG